jgi:hypothetical protein
MLGIPAQEDLSAAMIASPLVVPAMNELSSLKEVFPNFPLGGVLFNFTIYACMLGAFRHRCLTEAERYLRGAHARP